MSVAVASALSPSTHLWRATGVGPRADTLYYLHHRLGSMVAEHGLSLHQYADDSQIYGSCRSDATSLFSTTVSQCLDSIASWTHSNRLQLNTDKTEVMWCASTRKLPQLPSHPLSVAGALICPVNAVRDLGVFIDNDLGAATHVWR